jgi:hypothetical protein
MRATFSSYESASRQAVIGGRDFPRSRVRALPAPASAALVAFAADPLPDPPALEGAPASAWGRFGRVALRPPSAGISTAYPSTRHCRRWAGECPGASGRCLCRSAECLTMSAVGVPAPSPSGFASHLATRQTATPRSVHPSIADGGVAMVRTSKWANALNRCGIVRQAACLKSTLTSAKDLNDEPL